MKFRPHDEQGYGCEAVRCRAIGETLFGSGATPVNSGRRVLLCDAHTEAYWAEARALWGEGEGEPARPARQLGGQGGLW